MSDKVSVKRARILLVEDSEADVRLTKEAIKESKIDIGLDVVNDGVAATDFLRKSGKYKDAARPDIIILDLNLPRKDGREVLADIKNDPDLKRIPVVVMTSSKSEEDIIKCYDNYANCYITKPLDLGKFIEVVQAIEGFWFTIVEIPKK